MGSKDLDAAWIRASLRVLKFTGGQFSNCGSPVKWLSPPLAAQGRLRRALTHGEVDVPDEEHIMLGIHGEPLQQTSQQQGSSNVVNSMGGISSAQYGYTANSLLALILR